MKATGKMVIAGGTGFLGRNLATYLENAGCEVVLLSRNRPIDNPRSRHVQWDARSLGDWVENLEGATALINLAGRSVDCRKTPDHCDEILRSRVESTGVLGRALKQLSKPPGVWVQMATAHRYGDAVDVLCDEDSAFGYGLAPYVGQAWERTFAEAVPEGVRQVVLRTSFVLGRSGGALSQLARLARFGLGGTVGSGRQGISWIHEEDMNRLFERAIADDRMSGAYLATAPNPVSNAEFMRELRKVLGMPIGLPAASWMVKIGARWILNTDPELALYGRYCVSRRLAEEGFDFWFPELKSTLQDLYGKKTM